MNAPILILQLRVQAALKITEIYEAARRDYARTFQTLGLERQPAKKLALDILQRLLHSRDIVATEVEIYAMFQKIKVNGVPINLIIDQKMSGRAEVIFGQVSPYFAKMQSNDNLLDFGCGDGQVCQLLADRLNINVFGCDVRKYLAQGVTIPTLEMSGARVDCDDGAFNAGIMTNVAHHEAQNQRILNELERVIKIGGRLVVIETVPLQNTELDFGITFLNDYLYNRLFHQADIPVPGTYENKEEWIHRFESTGFLLENLSDYPKGFRTNPEHLGFDQRTIREWHVRYVFTRIE